MKLLSRTQNIIRPRVRAVWIDYKGVVPLLLSTFAYMKWNSKNKTYYQNKGYTFTKMRDEFVINVSDLKSGSNAPVAVKCDYCGKVFMITYDHYTYLRRKSSVLKDACKSCCELKAMEVIEAKYGGYRGLYFATSDKRNATNLRKYGSENVFGSDIIKARIIASNIQKFGVPYNQQCKAIREKTIATCLKKYGVHHYVELFKGVFIGENSPNWKGGVAFSRVERATHEYTVWRNAVYVRDMYTCQCCGAKSRAGKRVELHAHHKRNWVDNKEVRYDVENGITLCVDCHTAFHSMYGKRHNTSEQLEEFLASRRKDMLNWQEKQLPEQQDKKPVG